MKILNRIVVALLGLSVFPIVYFNVLLRAVVSISKESSLYTILSKLMEDTADRAMEITVTLKEAVGYIQDGKFSFAGMDFGIDKIPAEMLVTKNWAIAAGVLIVTALLIALVIVGCAIFTQAHKTIMCLGAGGAICMFSAIKCFGKFAAPFVDGTIDIGAFLGKSLIGENTGLIGSIGTAILDGAIKVDILQLGSAAITILLVFIGILMWTLAYYITLPEKPKKVKA